MPGNKLNRYKQPDEEQLYESQQQARKQADEEKRLWGSLIAEKRKAAGLSREQLAALAGLSVETVRNAEQGRGTLTQETLNRLRSVPQLGLPLSLNEPDPEPTGCWQAIWLPDFLPDALLTAFRTSLSSESPRIAYRTMHPTIDSATSYTTINHTGQYGEYVANLSSGFLQVIGKLHEHLNREWVDIECLTVGHGWPEFYLAKNLLGKGRIKINNISIVSENHLIAHNGLNIFRNHFLPLCEHKTRLRLIFGSHISYLQCLSLNRRTPKIFCLSGTLMNIDDGDLFLDYLCHKMRPGDCLVFDMMIPATYEQEPRSIIRSDPRLSNSLPRQYVSVIEENLKLNLSVGVPSLLHVEWSYDLQDCYGVSSRSLELYSVHVTGTVHRATARPFKVSCLRIHRHDVSTIERFLKARGLTLLNTAHVSYGESFGIQYSSKVLLFMRK